MPQNLKLKLLQKTFLSKIKRTEQTICPACLGGLMIAEFRLEVNSNLSPPISPKIRKREMILLEAMRLILQGLAA
jgi:hypothetical protein